MFESAMTFMFFPLFFLGIILISTWVLYTITGHYKEKSETAKEIHEGMGFILKHKYKYLILYIVFFGFISLTSVIGNNATTDPIVREDFRTPENTQRMNERTEQLMMRELITNDEREKRIEERKEKLDSFSNWRENKE